MVDDFDFWQARSLSGKVLFWADTEEEAAYAVRVYLEATHNTFHKRVITDADPPRQPGSRWTWPGWPRRWWRICARWRR